MYQKDYLLRQIEIAMRAIGKMLGLKIDYQPLAGIVFEHSELPADTNLRHLLLVLLSERKINEAENLLFEHIEEEPKKEYLAVALEFYATLAGMDEYELEMAGFSMQEVLDGLNKIKRVYGVKGE